MVNKELHTNIMTADLTRHHIPVDVTTKEKPKMDESKVWLNMMREEFLILKTELSGSDGKGGILGEIKTDLEKLEKVYHHMDEKLSTLITAQIRDKAELDAKIANMKSDVDKVGHIARIARDTVDGHIEKSEKEDEKEEETKRFRWDKVIGIFGIIGILFGILKGVGTL